MGGHYNCEASFCEEKEHVLCVSMANRVTASRVNKTVNVIMYFLLDLKKCSTLLDAMGAVFQHFALLQGLTCIL